jgi:hypothetical protein
MWRRLARYENAEEWRILHAQDAQKLYIYTVQRREVVVVVVGVCCGCCCPGENSSVSKEAEHRSRDAR